MLAHSFFEPLGNDRMLFTGGKQVRVSVTESPMIRIVHTMEEIRGPDPREFSRDFPDER
jgi:hypothetical protein